jgi:hypothetical protein
MRPVERKLARILAAAPGPGSFSVPELRDLAVEYLDAYDEELARGPDLAGRPHWNLWMSDADLKDSLFVVMVVRRDGLEFFCGRGTARAVRDFADGWVGNTDDVLAEARRRLAVAGNGVRVGRRAAENWLGRPLGLKE